MVAGTRSGQQGKSNKGARAKAGYTLLKEKVEAKDKELEDKGKELEEAKKERDEAKKERDEAKKELQEEKEGLEAHVETLVQRRLDQLTKVIASKPWPG